MVTNHTEHAQSTPVIDEATLAAMAATNHTEHAQSTPVIDEATSIPAEHILNSSAGVSLYSPLNNLRHIVVGRSPCIFLVALTFELGFLCSPLPGLQSRCRRLYPEMVGGGRDSSHEMVGGGRDFKKQELKEGVRERGAGGFLIGLRPEVKDSPNHPNEVRLEFQATYTSPNGISAAEIAHITAVTGRQKKGKRLPPKELMYLSRSSVDADLRVKIQDREFKSVRERVIGMLTKPKDKKRKPEPAAQSNARK